MLRFGEAVHVGIRVPFGTPPDCSEMFRFGRVDRCPTKSPAPGEATGLGIVRHGIPERLQCKAWSGFALDHHAGDACHLRASACLSFGRFKSVSDGPKNNRPNGNPRQCCYSDGSDGSDGCPSLSFFKGKEKRGETPDRHTPRGRKREVLVASR